MSLRSIHSQLNMYGFKRLSHGMDKGGYYHEMFLQSYPLLAKKIQRQKIKGNGPRRPAQPDQEPNFYAMPNLQAESLMPSQFHGYVVNNGCYAKPGVRPITLRNSLVMTANQINYRSIPPRSAALASSPASRGLDPSAAQATDPISIMPGASGSPRYDEEDMDALTQLASWF